MHRNRRPSAQTIRLLEALATHPATWRHGYDLAQATGLQSGTLYPLLIRLHDAGLLEAEWRPSPQPGRPARHVYRLTAAGAAFAREAPGKATGSAAGPAAIGARA